MLAEGATFERVGQALRTILVEHKKTPAAAYVAAASVQGPRGVSTGTIIVVVGVMPTARWDIGPRRVFTEQVEWIARVHVERRRAQGRRDDAKRPLPTVQVCAGGVRSRPTTLPAAPQRTFIRPAEDKMRPGGGEPRYAVSDCCSGIHVSTCPAQFGAPCQGLAPAEASRIPWGFCRYIQLYSLSLDTGNHSTRARARETASAGAWETPASGHAADRGRAGNDGREVTCLSV